MIFFTILHLFYIFFFTFIQLSDLCLSLHVRTGVHESLARIFYPSLPRKGIRTILFARIHEQFRGYSSKVVSFVVVTIKSHLFKKCYHVSPRTVCVIFKVTVLFEGKLCLQRVGTDSWSKALELGPFSFIQKWEEELSEPLPLCNALQKEEAACHQGAGSAGCVLCFAGGGGFGPWFCFRFPFIVGGSSSGGNLADVWVLDVDMSLNMGKSQLLCDLMVCHRSEALIKNSDPRVSFSERSWKLSFCRAGKSWSSACVRNCSSSSPPIFLWWRDSAPVSESVS